ncbi:ATP-dependent RNA helicase [Treponema zioleckii]|uniref:ATP-dependent RNA helicase n=1 Tax=Treponema zioleckii TaxID=331680 RepID=UPI00168BFB9D|nr:ATP-dependent helicase C-terminal domain-containing protein [Treponema zioleckii]
MDKTDSKYPDEIKNLPITPYLDEICEKLSLSKSRFLVLTAETAAGKSTAVPLALLKHFSGKILMLEPRRLAVTAIADRVASLLGEKTGKTAGYTLHLDSNISKDTRFEVITEAILTRRLQKDPLLEDINVIVIDEFHERSINADLVLAFLKETMELRDDLYVIVMSATINYQTLVKYLNAEFMKIPGRQFPVEIIYEDKLSIVSLIKSEFSLCSPPSKSGKNSILVFLPGIYEINKVFRELREVFSENEAEILILHSSVPLAEQRKVLSPAKQGSPRRIILSSAIAETSLTVPDVTTVIDSGLCRLNKTNVSLSMNQLVTEKCSMFSADQRAGRAGRVAPGKCIRLWNKNDVRPKDTPPEILRSDLSSLVLECAQWGGFAPEKLSWLDEPPKASWNGAFDLLKRLGCLKNGAITKKGKAVLTLGLNPRLACVALCGEKALPTVLKFSEFSDASPARQNCFLEDLSRRLSRVSETGFAVEDTALFLLEGFPDRIGKLTEVSNNQSVYQFVSGRKAVLDKINAPAWIVAPEVNAGSSIGKIYSYEPVEEKDILQWLNERSEVYTKADFVNDEKIKLEKYEIRSYGEIVLQKKKIPVEPSDFGEAVCNAVQEKGLKWLPIDSQIEAFLLRVEFYIAFGDEISKEVQNNKLSLQNFDFQVLKEKFENLQSKTNEWLLPFINSTNLNSKTVFDALYWYFDGTLIDREVPIQIVLPNGKKRKIIYEKQNGMIKPVLEVIIQHIFGCFETPKVLGVPVLLRLLSPARRPLQITEDLEHFWTGAWLEICKEMKSRYPKHNWDYRIAADD